LFHINYGKKVPDSGHYTKKAPPKGGAFGLVGPFGEDLAARGGDAGEFLGQVEDAFAAGGDGHLALDHNGVVFAFAASNDFVVEGFACGEFGSVEGLLFALTAGELAIDIDFYINRSLDENAGGSVSRSGWAFGTLSLGALALNGVLSLGLGGLGLCTLSLGALGFGFDRAFGGFIFDNPLAYHNAATAAEAGAVNDAAATTVARAINHTATAAEAGAVNNGRTEAGMNGNGIAAAAVARRIHSNRTSPMEIGSFGTGCQKCSHNQAVHRVIS